MNLRLYLLFLSVGVVRSVKETLNSQFVDNCRGVIARLTLKEKKMVWNRTTHIWYVLEFFIYLFITHLSYNKRSHFRFVFIFTKIL